MGPWLWWGTPRDLVRGRAQVPFPGSSRDQVNGCSPRSEMMLSAQSKNQEGSMGLGVQALMMDDGRWKLGQGRESPPPR